MTKLILYWGEGWGSQQCSSRNASIMWSPMLRCNGDVTKRFSFH